MRTLRYLNGVLTIIAVLLTLNMWMMWHTASPTLPNNEAQAAGLANAGKQRAEMIGQLKKLNVQLDALGTMLKEGKASVQVAQPKKKNGEGPDGEPNVQ
jgi:hypothetical protein